MEITLTDHLSPDEIKEIVSDELRNQIRKMFSDERESQRLLSNLSYQIVFEEIDKTTPNCQKLIETKTMEVLNDIKSFSVFRDGSYGGEPSHAYQLMENCVKNNKELLDQKVKETIINKDYSKEIWDKYEEMAETFMSNFYEIVRLGRTKES